MAFDNHLGSHQDVRLSVGKLFQNLPVSALPAGCIRIHPKNTDPRKFSGNHLRQALRSGSESRKVGRLTGRASVRQFYLIPAVVAHQPVSAVQGQRDIAVRTPHRLPAGTAGYEGGKSPAVDEKHDLLPSPETVCHSLTERAAEYGAVAFCELLPHVDHRSFGDPAFGHSPPAELHQMVSPTCSAVGALHGGRGRTQHHLCAAEARSRLRRLPGVIPRGILGLVGVLMLLIDDDKTEMGKWGKQRGAGADHDLTAAIQRPFPLVVALSLRHPGIHDGDTVAEPGVKAHHRLPGEGNLRNEKNCLETLREYLLDHLHIDLGFSASRNSVQKLRGPVSGVPAAAEVIKSLLLFFIQLFFSGRLDVCFLSAPHLLPGDYRNPVRRKKGLQGGIRDVQLLSCHLQGDFPTLQKGLQKTQAGPVVLLPGFLRLRHKLRIVHPAYQRLFHLWANLLPHGENRPERLMHGTAVGFMHPGSQAYQLGLHRQPTRVRLRNLLDLCRVIIRLAGEADDISMPQAVAGSEGNLYQISRLQRIFQRIRHSVVEGPVHAGVRDINNYFRVKHAAISPSFILLEPLNRTASPSRSSLFRNSVSSSLSSGALNASIRTLSRSPLAA